MNQTREKRIESRERSILFLVVSSRARHRNGNAFEISTPSSPPSTLPSFSTAEESRFYSPSPPPPPPRPPPPPSPRASPPLDEGRPKINVDHLYREHTLFDSLRDPRLLEWLIGTTTMDIFYTACPRHRGPRLKYIYCRCPRHNRILSDKKRTGPTALPYLPS